MIEKNDLVFIKHILDSINAIQTFSKNISKIKLVSDRLRRDAITREIEIIGEAVKNISQGTRAKYPVVEWKKIVGTRDLMIHKYFGVDLNIIWGVIKKDLPILEKHIKKIKRELEQNIR